MSPPPGLEKKEFLLIFSFNLKAVIFLLMTVFNVYQIIKVELNILLNTLTCITHSSLNS